MDSSTWDNLTRSVQAVLTRRRLGRLAGGVALAAAVSAVVSGNESEAKRRVRGEHNIRGKKAIMCIDGETRRVPKKKRKKYLKRGATRGACQVTPPVCVPKCPAGACGDDGCGGQCPACPMGQVCADGICQGCSVSCDVATETPAECGETLRTALLTGGNVYVCPGEYEGTFVLSTNVNVYGAGSGTDPATNAILTGSDTYQTMTVESPITVRLANVRLTNGYSTYGANLYIDDAVANVTTTDCVYAQGRGEYGQGIYVYYGTLAVDRCQFRNNEGNYYGGAILNYYGTVTLANSLFQDNIGESGGGALCAYDSPGAMQVTGCTFTGNTSDYGGAVYIYDGAASFSNSTFTRNTAETGGAIYVYNGPATLDATVSITNNTATDLAPSGGGVMVVGGTFTRNGATISGNTPDQCIGAGC
ncbi:MAG: right-handed parallel beta-helix repeat-containing protein [Thermomicrobiales bacterium]